MSQSSTSTSPSPAVVDQPGDSQRDRAVVTSGSSPAASREWSLKGTLASFVIVFLAITVWRIQVIASPPFWDSAMGLFVEANFLAETNFDYRRLAHEEKSFTDGGPAVYIVSIMPTLLALLMKISPAPTLTLVVFHLFTFACAAAVFLLTYSLLEPRTGATGAVLAGAAVLTTPLFVVQIDMLGMELPLIACALLVAHLVERQRFVGAALVSTLAFFIKVSGGVLTGATLVYLGLVVVSGSLSGRTAANRKYWIGIGANLTALAAQVSVFVWLDGLPNRSVEAWDHEVFRGLENLLAGVHLSPDFFLLLGIASLASLGVMAAWVNSLSPQSENDESAASERISVKRIFGQVHAALVDHPLWVLSWIVTLGVVSGLSLAYTIPRYLALPLPFMYVILATLCFARPSWRAPAAMAMALLIGLNVLNLEGRFFPPLSEEDRTGALQERSLAYLDDHAANIRLVRDLASRHKDATIVASSPLVHFLALPRLGYVEGPLHGYSMNAFTTPTFKPIERIRADRPESVLIVRDANLFILPSTATCHVPIPSDDDEIVWRDEAAPSLVVFRKEWSDAQRETDSEDATQDPYLATFWPAQLKTDLAMTLVDAGQTEAAEILLREAVELEPHDAEARYQLALLLDHSGRLDEAMEHYRLATRLNPRHAEAQNRLGGILADLGDEEHAIEQFQKAIALDPTLAEAHRNWGILLARAGKLDEAELQFSRAVEVRPGFAEAYQSWGLLLELKGESEKALECYEQAAQYAPQDPAPRFSQGAIMARLGRIDQAAECFEQALACDPSLPDAHFQLAAIRNQQRRIPDAVRHYRRAIRGRPGWPEAANNLAWLLATYDGPPLGAEGEAVQFAEHACQVTGYEQPEFLDTLAAALASDGRFEEAVETVEKAIRLAQGADDADAMQAMQERLELYRSTKPYRLTTRASEG